MPRATRNRTSVFLNVPFDRAYQPQFIALVAAVIAVGCAPRCVLEIADVGLGRLNRLLGLITSCEVSIHDLSRVGAPARFNMPFELGLACAVSRLSADHAFILLEREPYRLQRTLSDINGHDPYVHHGSIRGIITCVLDALAPSGAAPTPLQVFRLYRTMCIAAPALRVGRKTIFARSPFLSLVAVGVDRARQAGLLEP